MTNARIDALQRLEECQIFEPLARGHAARTLVRANRDGEAGPVVLPVPRERIAWYGVAHRFEFADDPPIRHLAQVQRAGRFREARTVAWSGMMRPITASALRASASVSATHAASTTVSASVVAIVPFGRPATTKRRAAASITYLRAVPTCAACDGNVPITT